MKTPIAITLIIMGALLIVAPLISDYLYQCNVTSVMLKGNVTSFNLAGKMDNSYRWACWVTGSGMIAVSVLSSIGSRKSAELGSGRSAQVA